MDRYKSPDNGHQAFYKVRGLVDVFYHDRIGECCGRDILSIPRAVPSENGVICGNICRMKHALSIAVIDGKVSDDGDVFTSHDIEHIVESIIVGRECIGKKKSSFGVCPDICGIPRGTFVLIPCKQRECLAVRNPCDG